MNVDREAGSAALEAGLVLPLVAVLLVALLAVQAVVADQLAVSRAARAGARGLALTGRHAVAVDAATRVAPDAQVRVDVRGGVGAVVVLVEGRVLGVPYGVDATASAPIEPAVP